MNLYRWIRKEYPYGSSKIFTNDLSLISIDNNDPVGNVTEEFNRDDFNRIKIGKSYWWASIVGQDLRFDVIDDAKRHIEASLPVGSKILNEKELNLL